MWPLRRFYLRVIEMVGRVVLPPIIVAYFFVNVSFSNPAYEIIGTTVITAYAVMVLLLEAKVVWRIWKECLLQLVEKINQPNITIREISWVERWVLNLILFQKNSYQSIYLSQYLYEKGNVKIKDSRNFMELRKEYQLKYLMMKEEDKEKEKKSSAAGNHNTSSNGLVELAMMGENPLHPQSSASPNTSAKMDFSQRFSMGSRRISEISVDSDDEKEV